MDQKMPVENPGSVQDLETATREPDGNQDGFQDGSELTNIENKSSSQKTSLPLEDIVKLMVQRIGILSEELKSYHEYLAKLSKGMEQLGTEKRVLTEMHDRCRELSEQFHEREFLKPIFLCLIGIADRCRQEIAKLRQTLKGYVNDTNIEVAFAIKSVIEARKADLIEIENLLANYGVESFRYSENKFDPKLQKCIRCVKCEDLGRHGLIAQQILPGYRRNGCILRPEYVSVYVPSIDNHQKGKV
jgi:molecular chaperone GrpE (heat shock protein)